MNVLIMNIKGGVAKSTTSSIAASYLDNSTLYELDRINKSADKYKTANFKTKQVSFKNSDSESFLEFENELFDANNKVIDVGVVMAEAAHIAFIESDIYSAFDVIVVPAMDGRDDFKEALKFLLAIKDSYDMSKVIFAFSRYNPSEYSSIEEQFDNFFDNYDALKKIGIDLKDKTSYFAIQDSKVIKKGNRAGKTVLEYANLDFDAVTKAQRAEADDKKRLALTKDRSLIKAAQNLERDYILPAIDKILSKAGVSDE